MTSNANVPNAPQPSRVRYGVLGFACSLSMITYLDRACFGTLGPNIQGDFGLSDSQLGILFTAFGFSYAIFEIPSGWLGDVFGPRLTLLRIVLWWSFFTALTGLIFPMPSYPWLAFALLALVRFMFGVGEAGAYPNLARALANWFPFRVRGSAKGAMWMAGRLAGGLTPFLVSAMLIQSTLEDGRVQTYWRHTFWIFGLLGIFWCLAFWWWFRDRPEEMPGVNAAELALIRGHEGPSVKAQARIDWLLFFSDRNLWALCAQYAFAAYGWYFNMNWLTKYLRDVFDVKKETVGLLQFGFMAGAPLLFGAAACLLGGVLTDLFIRVTGNRKWGRRLLGIVGHGTCGIFYLIAGDCVTAWTFVFAIAMAAFCNDLTMGSAWASCVDIGKQYAGIVAGCMNFIGNLGGAFAGYATGWILERYGWSANFQIYGGVFFAACLTWFLFDSTKPILLLRNPPSPTPTA